MSQCPQTNNLKQLDISNNILFWEDCEPLRYLLEKVSGILQHLEMDDCEITDAMISILLPTLSRCSQLRVLSFASNPITMFMLRRVLQHLLPLMDLSHVIYPIPLHCYRRWSVQPKLKQRKFDIVKAQLKRMLEEAGRSDMFLNTFPVSS